MLAPQILERLNFLVKNSNVEPAPTWDLGLMNLVLWPEVIEPVHNQQGSLVGFKLSGCKPETAYTVGHTESYDRYLAEDPNPRKSEGGSVWKTADDALNYLKQSKMVNFSVYEVQLVNGWDYDVRPRDTFDSLVVEAKIMKKVEFPDEIQG